MAYTFLTHYQHEGTFARTDAILDLFSKLQAVWKETQKGFWGKRNIIMQNLYHLVTAHKDEHLVGFYLLGNIHTCLPGVNMLVMLQSFEQGAGSAMIAFARFQCKTLCYAQDHPFWRKMQLRGYDDIMARQRRWRPYILFLYKDKTAVALNRNYEYMGMPRHDEDYKEARVFLGSHYLETMMPLQYFQTIENILAGHDLDMGPHMTIDQLYHEVMTEDSLLV